MTIEEKLELVLDFVKSEKQASFDYIYKAFYKRITEAELYCILYCCVDAGLMQVTNKDRWTKIYHYPTEGSNHVGD